MTRHSMSRYHSAHVASPVNKHQQQAHSPHLSGCLSRLFHTDLLHTLATMPPRKSTTRSQTHQQAQASSSKVTLDALAAPDLSETLTPDYRPDQRRRIRLSEEERGTLVHEVRDLPRMGKSV